MSNPNGLRELHITGFASLADVRLELSRTTVLVGANGSGKSNLLRALKMAPLIRTASLQRFVADVGGAAALLHYGPKHTPSLRLSLEFADDRGPVRYEAELSYAAGDRLAFKEETVLDHPAAADKAIESSLGEGHWESELGDSNGQPTGVQRASWWIARMNFFHFHDTSATSSLRPHARVEDDQYLRSDGSNLAAYLLRLANSTEHADASAWRRINHLVRRIAPAVKELAPTAVNGTAARLDWIDDRDERFGVHQLSDGTLRAISLITALGQPTERLPKFITIDEPELGLHPAAIAVLAELAHAVAPHTQVLFATQSTALLDHFDPADIVVAERRNGATEFQRLDGDALERWLEDYSMGQIFTKGVLGGVPSPVGYPHSSDSIRLS